MNSLPINTNSLLIDAETLRLQELAEKKKRRLERNRASARQCRKRKKEKKLLLRQQLAQLEAENLQLRLKLQVGSESDNHDAQSAIITTKLNEMITEGASETEIEKKIQELKERFSDYGRDRRSAIDFHINQLRRCLQPTQTTRAILWLMGLARRFSEITTGSSSSALELPFPTQDRELSALWYSLLEEIKPDPAQRNLMISYTTPSPSSDPNVIGSLDPFEQIRIVSETCNQTLDRIVAIICNKNDNLDQEMSNIQSYLSPRQIAKFILWIDKNPACMQMLEALWPHVTQSPVDQSFSPSNPTKKSTAAMMVPSASSHAFPVGTWGGSGDYEGGEGDDSGEDDMSSVSDNET